MVRLLAAALVLSALGCGGGGGPGKAAGRAPVTEADVQALIGRPAGDAVKLLGAPDRTDRAFLSWLRVPTAAGPRAIGVSYDEKTGAVTLVQSSVWPPPPGLPPGSPGVPGARR